MWLKIGVRKMHVVLLIICEFHENRHREGCTYVMGGKRNYMCRCTVKLRHVFESKERLGIACVLGDEMRLL
jgi:hypothetical protein